MHRPLPLTFWRIFFFSVCEVVLGSVATSALFIGDSSPCFLGPHLFQAFGVKHLLIPGCQCVSSRLISIVPVTSLKATVGDCRQASALWGRGGEQSPGREQAGSPSALTSGQAR